MNIRNAGLSACALALAFAASTAACAADSHQHAASDSGQLSLDHGHKWPTDAPLRQGMTAIRSALAAAHEAIHRGSLSATDFQALGAELEAQVAGIVANCRLEPAADANLHLVIARLLAGAAAMRGGSETTPAAGAAQAVEAVNDYGRYFDHPGWQPLG